MNKGLLGVLLGVVMAAQKGLSFVDLTEPGHASRTPEIPHKKHGGRTRAHAPNDGHWHMKFHRGRI